MIFRQLFEPVSSTYTYLVACEDTGQAALIDPVVPTMSRDMKLLAELGLQLVMTIETHVHADHITSALHLREELGSKIAFPAINKLSCADIQIVEGTPLKVGHVVIRPLFTPGHTDDHFSYVMQGRVLTGDSLLIDGCGRTDFQNGSAENLFNSIQDKLFTLDDDTLVYPGHDYHGRFVSSIAQEKARNPRIGSDTSIDQFIKTMSELELPHPTFIEYAVAGNQLCGECPGDLPENMEKYCQQMTESPQG
ncbi:MAG: Zn-dependent hydrolase [SAR86 cluster bacterium]|uniref:Zn-dependent hydrolase n=1 Tax=SAR86 cluster bacterium TaxID=2030880 RepID=A0A2A5AVZ3_9GAMM|nr:MAG: Zn-dependent hydrolase [SAR86 cluster bacterium]